MRPIVVARFKDKHVFGIGKASWGQKKRRFYAVGHRSFLDTEGEWLVEGSTLFFIPPGGDIASNPVTIAWGDEPVLQLKNLRGEVVRGKTISFGGGTGLAIRDCHDLLVADCTIECVSGDAIEIGGECDRIVISNCVVRNVGRRGVALNGGNRRTLAKGGNRIVGCDISRFALLQRVYAPGVAIHGCGNEVVGCRIHDAPHSAIIYGGNEHLIERNDIFDVVKETGDAGALYTGRDWTSQGNKVVRNHIHDLGRTISNGKSRDVFTMGVYLDDCDCGDTVASNVFERAGCAVMLGGVSRDGATVNRGSSRDQITHFVHGLYRYYESGMASRDEKDAIRGAFAALADRMIANVTETNGWNALDADGKQDAKGVGLNGQPPLWESHPDRIFSLLSAKFRLGK